VRDWPLQSVVLSATLTEARQKHPFSLLVAMPLDLNRLGASG